jgi:hypothetical protein
MNLDQYIAQVDAFADEVVRQDTANIVLDDYLERQGIERVTFLKMDLEGQELNGLRGLG